MFVGGWVASVYAGYDPTVHTLPKELGSKHIRFYEYCMFKNADQNMDHASSKTLQRLGLLDKKQIYSYIWNMNTNDNITFATLPTGANLANVIDCADTSCYTGTADCKCSYKKGIFDIGYHFEKFRENADLLRWFTNKRYDVHVYNQAVQFLIFPGAAYLQQKYGFLHLLMNTLYHKYVTLLITLVVYFRITIPQNRMYEVIKPLCHKNPLDNSDYTILDMVHKLFPSFVCNLTNGQALGGPQLLDIPVYISIITAILFAKYPRSRSRNTQASPFEMITGRNLKGEKVHTFAEDKDDDNTEVRNKLQLIRAQRINRRMLPGPQLTFDFANPIWRWWIAY
jgi:hypothetical protein